MSNHNELYPIAENLQLSGLGKNPETNESQTTESAASVAISSSDGLPAFKRTNHDTSGNSAPHSTSDFLHSADGGRERVLRTRQGLSESGGDAGRQTSELHAGTDDHAGEDSDSDGRSRTGRVTDLLSSVFPTQTDDVFNPEEHTEAIKAEIPALTPRQAYAAALRAVADYYEAHEEIKLPHDYTSIDNFAMHSKEDAATVIRSLGKCVKQYNDHALYIMKEMAPGVSIRFVFNRQQVCERVVVGQKVTPAQVLPPRLTETIIPEKVEDIVEWRCGSILASEVSL